MALASALVIGCGRVAVPPHPTASATVVDDDWVDARCSEVTDYVWRFFASRGTCPRDVHQLSGYLSTEPTGTNLDDVQSIDCSHGPGFLSVTIHWSTPDRRFSVVHIDFFQSS